MPVAGRKPAGGSSAYRRASTAWPCGSELVLAQRQRLAGGDAQLLLDEVDAVDQLGHRVLDLQPGVHLEEEELAGVVRSAMNSTVPAPS